MRHLTEGDAFVCAVFQHGALLHSGTNALPSRKVFVCHETLLQQTREGWRRWFNNSCQFMDCAGYCLMEHKFSMAVFMIHRSEEHTSELQSLMRISYAVFCLKKKKNISKQQ